MLSESVAGSPRNTHAFNEVAENLPLLGLAGIYSMTFADRRKLLQSVEVTAALASVVGALVLTVLYGSQYRPELAAGNASVLALVSSVLFVLTVSAAIRRKGYATLFFAAAAVAAALMVLATGTRSAWPALIMVPLLALFVFRLRGRVGAFVVLLATLAGLIVGGLSVSTVLETRIEQAQVDIENAMSGDMSGAIGERIRIYRAGYELFLEKPVFGYGPGNERREIVRKTGEGGAEPIAFSHAHNAALNAVLRAGIVGLLALAAMLIVPFVVAFRAEKDEVGQVGFFVLSGVLIVYLCSGFFGLMLGHDIHDAVFITAISYTLYLIFGAAGTNRDAARQV
ncbi:O-antigen ligase family protein [Hoeflea sp. G2-23]|uniref:O-antigen ligase family protein n=1 Tax=Hoeflea algicola TaxID=2983763 RepID=A0ABT3ZCP4_9HYPH|nr:O-antigen ligase family protein [Hoeflea algicola]MCY0149418.1 O-antigen ligase family protein [Hoeflea algicola]